MSTKRTRGLVLGKFLPPHLGHKYLIDFAQSRVDELAVVVGTLKREPIPGPLRVSWMKELFPDACVLHLEDENPQYPEEHPDFWDIWRRSLQRILPWKPDYVFASEEYGHRLAAELEAEFVAVDCARETVPISATRIREDPQANWEYLPLCVRPYYARRICVFGPESTGKTTLCKQLSECFQTTWVPEFAREYLEKRRGELGVEDLIPIAHGQREAEDKHARVCARGLLFCDTDALATPLWSQALFGQVEPELANFAKKRPSDFYLLTDTDLPWEEDEVRYLPEGGADFLAACKRALEDASLPYAVVHGRDTQRLQSALQALKEHLSLLPPN